MTEKEAVIIALVYKKRLFEMKELTLKNFPVWAIFILQLVGMVISGAILYLNFKPDSPDDIDAYFFGMSALVFSMLGAIFGLVRDRIIASEDLKAEMKRVREYEDLVERAVHTINVVNGGEGIPKIRIQVMKSTHFDRYPIWIYCENHDQFPIHDLQITIEDPDLMPPPLGIAGAPSSTGADLVALSDAFIKGFYQRIGPFTLPANYAEVVYKTSLRIEEQRGGGYEIGVRWRKGHYLLIIPNRYVENFLPVFERPKILINNERISKSHSANYYTFDSYINNSITQAEEMEQRFREGKRIFSP